MKVWLFTDTLAAPGLKRYAYISIVPAWRQRIVSQTVGLVVCRHVGRPRVEKPAGADTDVSVQERVQPQVRMRVRKQVSQALHSGRGEGWCHFFSVGWGLVWCGVACVCVCVCGCVCVCVCVCVCARAGVAEAPVVSA